jgi:hypothetical protein
VGQRRAIGGERHAIVALADQCNCKSELTQSRAALNDAAFKDFSAGNDPHNEHDFGAIEVDGNKIFWNARVLTIMLAREY